MSGTPATALPAAHPVELPGRGTTFASDVPGPPGAPTLLLLHGLMATGRLNWYPAVGPLAEHFRVVTMDLRGHGRGIPADGRFRIADSADDAAALAGVLGIDRFIAVGYSLGGPVAQLVWHRHRSQVDGLVLCATSRNFGGSIQERLFFRALFAGTLTVGTGQRATTALRRASGGRTDEPAPGQEGARLEELNGLQLSEWAIGELRSCSPSTLLSALGALGRFSSHRWAGDIDVPTAVVVTSADRVIAPARQAKLAQAIPGATVHPAPGGHSACVLGAQTFVPVLLEACLSVAGRRPSRAGAEPSPPTTASGG